MRQEGPSSLTLFGITLEAIVSTEGGKKYNHWKEELKYININISMYKKTKKI
jgi:hypothetical protein